MTPVFWFLEPIVKLVFFEVGRHSGRLGMACFLNRSLTVPLLCGGCGFKVKECHQVQGSITRVETLDDGPEVDHVSLDGALGMEALEDIIFQVDTESTSLALAVHGTGATPLVAPTA